MESARLLDRFLNDCLLIPSAKLDGEFDEDQYNAIQRMPCISELRQNETCAKTLEMYEEGLVTYTELQRNITLALYEGGL